MENPQKWHEMNDSTTVGFEPIPTAMLWELDTISSLDHILNRIMLRMQYMDQALHSWWQFGTFDGSSIVSENSRHLPSQSPSLLGYTSKVKRKNSFGCLQPKGFQHKNQPFTFHAQLASYPSSLPSPLMHMPSQSALHIAVFGCRKMGSWWCKWWLMPIQPGARASMISFSSPKTTLRFPLPQSVKFINLPAHQIELYDHIGSGCPIYKSYIILEKQGHE